MMTRAEFAKRIRLSDEWLKLDLYPDEIFLGQVQEFLKEGNTTDVEFIPGDEHYRNGVYWYWIRRPDEIDMMILRSLVELDRDLPLRRATLKILQRLERQSNILSGAPGE